MSKEYKKEKKWSKDRRTTAHRSISLSFVSRWKDGRFVSSNTPLHALVNEYVGGNVPAHPVFTNTLAQIRTQTRTRTRARSRRARRKFKRSVHLHARLFPISRMLSPPFDSYALYVPRRIRRVHKILFPFISPFSCLGRPSVIPSKRCLSPTDNYLIFMNTFYSRDRINIKTYLPFIRLCASSRGY